MVTNRGHYGPDRTTGLGSGSNYEGAMVTLTFAAIDTIVRNLTELSFHGSAASVHPGCERETPSRPSEEVYMKGENRVNKSMPKSSYRIVTIICGGLLLSGCVM